MEAQWREAIKIINNNTKSPTFSNSHDFSTIDQLNSLRSKSHVNLDQLLSLNTKNDQPVVEAKCRQSGAANHETNADRLGSVSSVINDNFRHASYQLPTETPVTSKPQKSKKQEAEHELQKYIQLVSRDS